MIWQIVRSMSLAVCLSALLLFDSAFAHANDLEQNLRDKYQGKIFVLRGFYSDYQLIYDSAGRPNSGASPGDWTVDGFVQVDHIQLSGQSLKIKTRRLMVISADGFQFHGREKRKKHKSPKKEEVLDIEAKPEVGSFTEDGVNVLLSKIFLTSQDNFSEQVPEFWKLCIADGFAGRNRRCHFSAEIAGVPGISSQSQTSAPSQTGDVSPPASDAAVTKPPSLVRVGGGVKPPRVIYQPEPSFSEPARRAKYQGVVVLWLVVGRDGLPTEIHVTIPLGAGLDARAVQAVGAWKFQPAQKDGQPVPVKIAVEVDFHLY
ncbi:MAG: hypothetical protein DMG78_28950 [Acidobacteria bacterium]|nr:MAG: hypothetical protein DMG78_28950 [Acidobacteriota bacterium]